AGLNRAVGRRVIYFFSTKHTLKRVNAKKTLGHWGGTAMYVFDHGDPMHPDRVVSCVREHDGWKFDEYGEALPFEDKSRYRSSSPCFDADVLRHYLQPLGLDPFDPAFFRIQPDMSGRLALRVDGGSAREIVLETSEEKLRQTWYAELGVSVN